MKSIDFGFIFARVLRHYAMSVPELLALPAKTFWMLHKNVDRLLAEDSLRLVEIGISSQSGEMAQKLGTALRKQMGTVVEIDEAAAAMNMPFDREGLNKLKGLGKVMG